MKKSLILVTTLVFAVVALAGCGAATGASKDEAVKTGLAVITSIAKSSEPGEKDGLAQTDSLIAAVTVDKDGKIVKCSIDSAQTKINFSKEGKILSDLKAELKSKQELGEGYGMKSASGIKKEWNEQADAFAAYVAGKTIDQVKGIAVSEEGTPADKELSSSVTIHIGDFMKVVANAVTNAQDFGAKAGDKLGLAVITNIAKSADAGEKDGLAQAYSTYTAATFDASGKITSCVIDASQANVNFTKEGKITTDVKAEVKTKNELGDAYGMKKASKIGKEWNEQAAAYAKFVVGKTLDEVKGVAVNEEGVPNASELTSSVTIHIGDFNKLIEKASATAK